MLNTLLRPVLVVLSLSLLGTLAPVHASVADEQEPWIRVDDTRQGVLDLDVAERVYTKEGMPNVTLVGAIHIGDPRFYKHLTKTLEAFDVVLYEGVGPSGAGELPADLSDEERVKRTEGRIRLFATMLEAMKRGAEASEEQTWDGYPADLDALHERAHELDLGDRQLEWISDSATDAWGRPLLYSATEGGSDFTLVSYGADGKEGGRGVDRDLSIAIQPPLSDAELGAEPGLQQKMADTFGLAFQGDIMSHDFENHINADLSVDEVRTLLEEKGGDGSMIFGMLDGSSSMAAMADIVFSIIKFIPGGSAMGKLMIMEMLANADDALAVAGAQPGMGNPEALMEVIIVDRNKKVIEDLKGQLASKRMWNNGIGVIYGAGHMQDLHERMLALGYELTESDWNLAIRLNLRKEGIPESAANMMRMQIRSQIKAMTGAAGASDEL